MSSGLRRRELGAGSRDGGQERAAGDALTQQVQTGREAEFSWTWPDHTLSSGQTLTLQARSLCADNGADTACPTVSI